MTPPKGIPLHLDFGVSTFTEYDSDGFLGLQWDGYGEEAAGVTSFESFGPFGFKSRPLDPDPTGLGCRVLLVHEGDQVHTLPLEDPRVTPLLPALKKGGSAQYCGKGGFAEFNGDDDTWTLYVPTAFDGNGKPTAAHLLQVGVDANGKALINIMHANGVHLSITDDAKHTAVIANKANNACITINDDGIGFNGNVKLGGNIGVGPLTEAWMTQVVIAITALSALVKPPGPVAGGVTIPLVGPPPISLTA